MHEKIKECLNSLGKPYIVGSSAIMEVFNINKKMKDVDILMETEVEVKEIQKKLENLGGIYLSSNSCGGLKIDYKGTSYDIWRVKDTTIYLEEYERTYKTAEDVISNFGYNLYQVGIRPDGEIFCTIPFMQYAIHRELKLINYNIRNFERLSIKAIENDVFIRKCLK